MSTHHKPNLPHGLLTHEPELPMAERVRRYQHNIRIRRALGLTLPSHVMPDTLDRKKIEAWFAESAATSERLKRLIGKLARLPNNTLVPWPLAEAAQ